MGRRRRRSDGEPEQRSPLLDLLGVVVFGYGAVQSFGGAMALMATAPGECPGVVDTNDGRGVDYECVSSGGGAVGWGVLTLVVVGLALGLGAVCFAVSLARGRRTRAHDGPPPTDAPTDGSADAPDAVATDLAELEALHRRGLLTAEELEAARERRRRQA